MGDEENKPSFDISEDGDKSSFLGEKVVSKTIDPNTKEEISKRVFFNKIDDCQYDFDSTQMQKTDSEDTESESTFDPDYINARVKPPNLTLRDRLKTFWVTKEMLDKDPDCDLRMRTTMAEFFTFTLFLMVTLVVVYGKRSISEYHLTDSLRRSLISSKFKNPQFRTFTYTEIKSAPDIWAFLLGPFVDTLYTEYYFSDVQKYPKRLTKVLYENVLVGLPRIRMKANRADSCHIHHAFSQEFAACFDYYKEIDENKTSFGNTKLWEWTDDDVDYSFWGNFGIYNPGGYSEVLAYSSGDDSKAIINTMKRNSWVSRRTRAIFLDFLVYNAPVNLFCRVQLVLELPPTGGVYPLYSFKTVKLFSFITATDYVVGGFEITFAIFTLYYILEEIIEIKYLKRRYFFYFTNVIDLGIIGCGTYISVFLLIKAIEFTPKITKLIQDNQMEREYISLDGYILYEWIYYKICGVLIFLCHLKIFNYCHFTSYMSLLNIVIIRSLKHILGFMIMFGLVFFAFAELGYLLFGATARQFRTYWISVFTLFKILLGDFDYLELEESDRIVGPLYFLSYLFTVFFFMVNMFLAIVNETYVLARHEKERFGIQDCLPLGNYLKRGFYGLFPFFRQPTCEAENQKRAKDALLRVKHALLRSNFTLTEINMFLAKYGIDGKKPTHTDDIARIVTDLEKKGYAPMEPPTLEELKLYNKGIIDEQDVLSESKWTGLTLSNFKELMTRLIYIQKQVTSTSRRLSNVGELIENSSLK